MSCPCLKSDFTVKIRYDFLDTKYDDNEISLESLKCNFFISVDELSHDKVIFIIKCWEWEKERKSVEHLNYMFVIYHRKIKLLFWRCLTIIDIYL